MTHSTRLEIQGIKVHVIRRNAAFKKVRNYLKSRGPKTVGFVNAHCFNVARRDQKYKDIVNSFDLVLPDGIGLRIAFALRGRLKYDNLNGTDFIPRILQRFVKLNYKIFLLGAKSHVIQKLKSDMAVTYPSLKIVGYAHGYQIHRRNDLIIRSINKSKPDIVLVAMGVPFQEKWIHKNKDSINARVLIGVGGLFDFMACERERAPLMLRNFGVEWVFRMMQEPKRLWKRYAIGNPVFIYYAVKEGILNGLQSIVIFGKSHD